MGAISYNVRLHDLNDPLARFTDARFANCPSSPHYYCVNTVGGTSITSVPVYAGHTYQYWVEANSIAGTCASPTAHFSVVEPAAPSVTLTAVPASITTGQSSLLTWSSANASFCSGHRHSVSGSTAGTTSVTPTLTTTYGVICHGIGTGPHVRTFNSSGGDFAASLLAYSSNFVGGVFVASGDVTGDSKAEIITGADAGGGPHVRVFDDKGAEVGGSFFAYAPTFTGGARVAAGNVVSGGKSEIITGAGPGGGPHVRVFNAIGGELGSFFAYDVGFTGGVYVAAGDVQAGPDAEIVTGAGAGGGPHVRIFNAAGVDVGGGGFFAFSSAFTGGVRVAAGNVTGGSAAEIITSTGPSNGTGGITVSTVRVFNASGSQLAEFQPYPGFTGGIYVGTIPDVNGDGREEILTGADTGGGPHVKVVDVNGNLVGGNFFAYGPGLTVGVRVAGGNIDGAGGPEIITSPGPSVGGSGQALATVTVTPPLPPPPGNIRGRIWLDTNDNGLKDGNEPLIQDVGMSCPGGILHFTLNNAQVVRISGPQNFSVETQYCSSGAYYDSGPLTPGSYTIRINPPAGWVRTTPLDVTLTVPAGGTAGGISAQNSAWFGIRSGFFFKEIFPE